MAQYKIVITRIDEKKEMKRGDWQTVEERPYTEEELQKADYHTKQAVQSAAEAGKVITKNIYGHPPATEVVTYVETKVYEQQAENIDIADIIRAVNPPKSKIS